NPAGYLRRAIEEDYAIPEPRRPKPTARATSAKSADEKPAGTRVRKRPAGESGAAVRDVEEAPLAPRSREGIDPERLETLRERARQMVLERYPVLAQRSTSPAFDVMVDACLDEILAVEGPATLAAE
ncbi:MAG TPA: hypothetical protein PLH36_03665, partial [Armatimonadota bacterium]|nr:hypothetical protein [Armatimonadota bacterium]